MRVLIASLLLAVSGAAAAQPTPAPKQEPRLNLKLDEADLRSLSRSTANSRAPTEEKSAADTLPSLGGDARTLERVPAPSSGSRRPYPEDSERVNMK